MDVDIESLTEEQLVALNTLIVARLRFLRDQRAHAAMLDLRVGQRVAFHPPGRPLLRGVLTRYNRKTVTVVTDAGEQWNVAPGLVWPADRPEHRPPAAGGGTGVIPIDGRPRPGRGV